MILSLIIIAIAYYWLLRETDFLRCNLRGDNSIAAQCNEHWKHTPQIEPCKVKTCSYPVPEPVKLLAEFCEITQYQQNSELNRYGRYRRYNYNGSDPINKESYETILIGGHSLTLNATNPKLYELMADFQKLADNKPRKTTAKTAPLPNFIRTVRTGSHTEWIPNKTWNDDGTVTEDKKHGYHKIVEEHETMFDDCLCGKEWLKAHYQDVIPEPTIDLVVNGKETHFNGNYKSGVIHTFMVVNAELWERPRIKGKKIKPEPVTA
jgi:hypothetical protein